MISDELDLAIRLDRVWGPARTELQDAFIDLLLVAHLAAAEEETPSLVTRRRFADAVSRWATAVDAMYLEAGLEPVLAIIYTREEESS